MWLGESQHTVDAKNRVFLPKRFLSGLDRPEAAGQPTAIVTRGFEDCLFLFSESGFQKALARLETQAFAREEARRMQRLFFSQSHPVQLDAQARVLLPEKLKSLAGIEKEVVMIGLIERIEIWAKERWDAFESEHGPDFNRLDGVLVSGVPSAVSGSGPGPGPGSGSGAGAG